MRNIDLWTCKELARGQRRKNTLRVVQRRVCESFVHAPLRTVCHIMILMMFLHEKSGLCLCWLLRVGRTHTVAANSQRDVKDSKQVTWQLQSMALIINVVNWKTEIPINVAVLVCLFDQQLYICKLPTVLFLCPFSFIMQYTKPSFMSIITNCSQLHTRTIK